MAIQGRWRKGYVLDYHTLGSVYLGADEYGHPIFDTKRSEIGELLYRLKYRSDASSVAEIREAATVFINKWNPGIDYIVPVPPSRPDRHFQPAAALASAMSEKLNIPVIENCIINI